MLIIFLIVVLRLVSLNMTNGDPLFSLSASVPFDFVSVVWTVCFILAEFAKVIPLMLGRVISVVLALLLFRMTPMMFGGNLVLV